MTNLENLSPIDFEELCRDLAQADTGNRFSAFGPGPDGGIDGRHSRGDDTTILQCKHYIRSSFSDLKIALTKEIKKLQKLTPVPTRYLFFTSHSLSPNKSGELAAICSPFLQQPGDIWGREDIEAAVKRYPEIEKSHIKLWLSSTAVLERIINSGLEAFTHVTKEDIRDALRVYVRGPSFDEATRILEQEKILIISGSPGVGKTTLAHMITYCYLNENWRLTAINSLEQGFSKIDDNTPTVFFFDDFLGRVELDKQSLLQKETVFGAFVKRIRRSINALFILTTRAHIFEEARLLSDYIDNDSLRLAKYVLDVGVYTRRIKSHILFNHLNSSELTQEHFAALLNDDWLKKIVDHKNYNPRLIASVSSNCLDEVRPEQYPSYVFQALLNPNLLWSKPFRALNMRCQNLLICLYFGNQYGQSIDELKANFFDVHCLVSKRHSQPSMPHDFEAALKSLESGFITISDGTVRFVNPSVRDFLKAHLTEIEFLLLLPSGARRADWARNLWTHVKSKFETRPDILEKISCEFIAFTSEIDKTPTRDRKSFEGNWFHSSDDLCLTSRVELLLQWWEHSQNDVFFRCAIKLLQPNSLELVPWRDGHQFPELYWRVDNFIDNDYPLKHDLKFNLMERFIETIESGVAIDDLIKIVEGTNEYMGDNAPVEVGTILNLAIDEEFNETRDRIDHLDTEQELAEHIDYIETLAKLTDRDPSTALSNIYDKLSELEESAQEEEKPNLPSRSSLLYDDKFGDDDLRSLFSNLILP